MKLENKKVFFGEKGLTSNSANFIANKAKEMVENLKISQLSFVDTVVKPLDSDEVTVISKGYTEDVNFENTLKRIGELHALEAWLREGIKAKTDMTNYVNNISFENWAERNKIDVPKRPLLTEVEDDDYLATISERDLVEHYKNEAYASVIGKFIHPGGVFDAARSELKNRLEKSNELVQGKNKDYLYTYTPTVDPQSVEEVYFNLQDKHREYQALVNKDVYAKEEWERDKRREYSDEYNDLWNKHDKELSKLYEDYRKWRDNELKKVQDLKIVVPKALKLIFDEVNGK